MLNFHEDYRNLTQEQLREKDEKLHDELNAINERVKRHPKSLTADATRRVADISDWLDACSQPEYPNGDPRSYAGQPSVGSLGGGPVTLVGQEQNNLAFGQYLQAVAAAQSSPGMRFGQFESGRIYRNVLEPEEARASGLQESVPSQGGFLVNKDFSTEIFDKAHETSKIWNRVRRIPISGNANGLKFPIVDESSRADGSRTGGVQAFWLQEAGTKTSSKPSFGLLELSLKKLIVLAYATEELIQDAAILGAFIKEAASNEIGFKLDDGVIRGSGAGQLLGILNANALVTVDKAGGQVAGSLIYENILAMVAQFWAPSFGNSIWLGNQNIIPQLFSMNLTVGTAGIPVFSPANGSSGSKSTLFGRPIEFVEQCSTLGTTGDLILMDGSQYLGITKSGIQSAVSMHILFTTDEICYRFVMRCDGQPMWSSALTPYKGGDDISPFVVIETRS